MMLQPIVENSILHGFGEEANNKIHISVKPITVDQNTVIQIKITDNGCGFAYEWLERLTGIGLRNVIQRMHIFFENEFRYEIESHLGQGTVVIFEISNKKES